MAREHDQERRQPAPAETAPQVEESPASTGPQMWPASSASDRAFGTAPKKGEPEIDATKEASIGGTERKGGFLASAGMELDEKRVQKTRDKE